MRPSLPRKAKNSEAARKERERILKILKPRSRTVGAPANNPRISSRSRVRSTSPSPPSPPTSSTVANKRGRQPSGKTDESRKKHPRNDDSVRDDVQDEFRTHVDDDVNKNDENMTETAAREESKSDKDSLFDGSSSSNLDDLDVDLEFLPPPSQPHIANQSNFAPTAAPVAKPDLGRHAPVGDKESKSDKDPLCDVSKDDGDEYDADIECSPPSPQRHRSVESDVVPNSNAPVECGGRAPVGDQGASEENQENVSGQSKLRQLYDSHREEARCGSGDDMIIHATAELPVHVDGNLLSARLLRRCTDGDVIEITTRKSQIPVIKQEEFEVITIESSDEGTTENEGGPERNQATGRRLGDGTKNLYKLPTLFGSACLDKWKKFINNVEDSEDADDNTQFERALMTLSVEQQHAVFNSGDYCHWFTEVELVLEDGVLIEVAVKEELQRRAENSNNEAGVVAWKLRLFTPEKPKGYDLVFIATDITQSGSFAIHEDKIFKLASEYSQQKKIPRAIIFYISEARIGLGDLHLQDSGLIAGETAYNEVPTFCLVTGASVGIGVNTAQLGGIHTMHKNGVAQSVVTDKLEGVGQIVQWMGYLPKYTENYPFHEKFGLDQKPRLVDFTIEPNKPYDIRNLIDSMLPDMTSGICDTSSFDEIMGEWAKTIIAGRARIGGIPIGIVSSELRATSQDQIATSSGDPLVCYSESAVKTAEVIEAFNREGLPLLFIASPCGVSGGQKDMYDMVEFGAQIVDALKQYKQPVVIYIPMQEERVGGVWAVLDSKTNPGLITTVMDEESPGGILEPNAIVGIKDKMLALQKRKDELQHWNKKLSDEIRNNGADTDEAEYLSNLMKKGSAELKKARMHTKGAVQHVTDLANSRILFIQIFSLENTKIHLAKEYKSVAHDVTLNGSYKWVQDQLEAYNPGFISRSPSEQADVVEKFVSEGRFRENLNIVHEDYFQRHILSMPQDVRERLIQRQLSRMNNV